MNTLYPIFLKLENLQMLMVGAGMVGTEKLTFILKNSPEAKITIVATFFADAVKELCNGNPNITILEKEFEESDIQNQQIIIAATNDKILNKKIYDVAKSKNILINVADTPELCDFYLSSIVTKGNLKIAISTNGKSPTLAKRMREMFEQILPENIDELLENLHQYRKKLSVNFEEKVKLLNELTKDFKIKDF